MKSFNEHINENRSEKGLRKLMDVPVELDKFEKLSRGKALTLKYVLYLPDDDMRDKVAITFSASEDEFIVKSKNEFFHGNEHKTQYAQAAWNYAKVCYIEKDISVAVANTVFQIIKSNQTMEWKDVIHEFMEEHLKNIKEKVKSSDLKALGVSDTKISANQFGM